MLRIIKKILTLILICQLNLALAQKKYPYTYDIHLKSVPSTYRLLYDSVPGTKGHLFFTAIDATGDTVTFGIKLSVNAFPADSGLPYQYSKFEPVYDLALNPGSYRLTATSLEYTPLTIEPLIIYHGTTTRLLVSSGYMNLLEHGTIHSKRKLSAEEIDHIIDHFSHRKKDDPELIRQKICFVLWQI